MFVSVSSDSSLTSGGHMATNGRHRHHHHEHDNNNHIDHHHHHHKHHQHHHHHHHRRHTTGGGVSVSVFGWALVWLCVLQTVFVCTSLVSPVTALEEDEYSVTSLLPSFKTLLFWRSSDEKINSAKVIVSGGGGSGANVAAVVTPPGDHHHPHPHHPHQSFNAATGALTRSRPSVSKWWMGPGETTVATTTTTGDRHRPNDKDNRICHSCRDNSVFVNEHEEYRQRIEFIKEQILTRLGMKRPPPPRPDIDLNLYMRIAENTIGQREQLTTEGSSSSSGRVGSNSGSGGAGHEWIPDPNTDEVDKVFILPLPNHHLKAPTFDISTVDSSAASTSQSIKSIYILVHYNLTENYYRLINDDTDLFITSDPAEQGPNGGVGGGGEGDDGSNHITGQDGGRKATTTSLEILSTVSPMRQSEQHQQDFDTAHWYQYDVTALLSDYTGKTITIHNNNFDILNSVIIIEMATHKLIRAKRSIDCTDSVSFCCRQHFYVNFTTIGWNNWIFQPAGYNANYCRGKCDLSHARYHHTTVIGKYPAIKLCCSPREMSSISLIYMDDKFNIYQKNLPNMVVESCDCA